MVHVDLQRLAVRDQILRKGTEIHKIIETQVMGDDIELLVETHTDEEKWALRLVNLILGLHLLPGSRRTVYLSVSCGH